MPPTTEGDCSPLGAIGEATDAIEEARVDVGVIVPDLYTDGNVWGGEVYLDTSVLVYLVYRRAGLYG